MFVAFAKFNYIQRTSLILKVNQLFAKKNTFFKFLAENEDTVKFSFEQFIHSAWGFFNMTSRGQHCVFNERDSSHALQIQQPGCHLQQVAISISGAWWGGSVSASMLWYGSLRHHRVYGETVHLLMHHITRLSSQMQSSGLHLTAFIPCASQ